jgi:hypothetical protein
MKKSILIITFLVSILTCKGQTNTIDSNELTINNLEMFGKDKSFLIQNLSNPISITQEYFEIQELYADVYTYDGILFYLVDNYIDTFKISNNKFSFTNFKIKVGDNISNLKNYYPISFNSRKDNAIVLSLTDIDASVVIEYNPSTIITSIE